MKMSVHMNISDFLKSWISDRNVIQEKVNYYSLTAKGKKSQVKV